MKRNEKNWKIKEGKENVKKVKHFYLTSLKIYLDYVRYNS